MRRRGSVIVVRKRAARGESGGVTACEMVDMKGRRMRNERGSAGVRKRALESVRVVEWEKWE